MVSAIISTYNRDRYLPDVLQSLSEQTLDVDKFEIILVNNNSTDNTEKISLEFKENNPEMQFHYFLETKQGLSHARNRGINESKGDILVFVDDDAFLSKGYLEEVATYLSKHESVDAIGGKILLKFEKERPKWANKYLDPLWAALDMGEEEIPFRNGKYPIGCNMAFKKDVFDQIGLFNTELGRTGKNLAGGEEKDIFMRMYEKDMSVHYLPKAYVHHSIPETRTTPDFIRKQALGIGMSERIRSKSNGTYMKTVFREMFKWGGSIVLFVIYTFKGQFPKGWMILKFRTWVTKGITQKAT